MQGGALYCVIVGGVALLAVLITLGTIATLYIMDKWSKRHDPGAPGFLELDQRGRPKTGDDRMEKRQDPQRPEEQ
jgi:hypothetical protein